MSEENQLKRPLLTPKLVANSSTECNNTPHKRRRQTNQALEVLGQLIKDSSVDDVDNKLNKNDILSLTLARLIRRKYWPSHSPNLNVQLATEIESPSITGDLNGFIIVLNTSGRIVLMSDHVEYYLRKNVRSLYPQLTSIYDCVSKADHEPIRRVLSSPTNTEQKVICTWILPRGKRPSRTHMESKSMLMTGHFFMIEDEENKEQQEPLFIARCEQILSSTPNIPTNSIGTPSATTLRFVLSDQLNINEISSNTEFLLGYKAEELIDQSINRLIPLEHLNILEQARQNCMLGHHSTTMNVIDLYTHDGDRLTFLCNTHMMIEGRRKAMKLGFIAQLIDPSIQYELVTYANAQNLERLQATIQHESTLIPSLNFNSLSPTDNLLSRNEQCLNLNDLSTVCPVTVIPQRRKRRRVTRQTVKNEVCNFVDTVQQTPQITSDFNEYQTSSTDSLTSSSSSSSSSSSPIQELGCMDGLFSYFEDIFPQDDIKLIHDFPTIDDINDILGFNTEPQFSLITPTMTTLSFFA